MSNRKLGALLAVPLITILVLSGCVQGNNVDPGPTPASTSTSAPVDPAAERGDTVTTDESSVDGQYETAMTKCIAMASEAMPNGMQAPDEPSVVLDSKQFCDRLAAGYTREKFAELYNDPEWLANELKIWSDEGVS